MTENLTTTLVLSLAGSVVCLTNAGLLEQQNDSPCDTAQRFARWADGKHLEQTRPPQEILVLLVFQGVEMNFSNHRFRGATPVVHRWEHRDSQFRSLSLSV